MIKFGFGMLSTAALSLIMYLIGSLIVSKVGFLRKYYIPIPVVGGLLFAFVNLALTMLKVTDFSFDTTIQSIAMTLFFTSVGYASSLHDLKRGGAGVALLLICAAFLIALQNGVGIGLCALLGIDKKIGVLVGSVPYTGGNGTAAAWAVAFEEQYGVDYAMALGNAAATVGLVAGGLLGGPVARFLSGIKHRHSDAAHEDHDIECEKKRLSAEGMFKVLVTLLVCMGISELLNPYFARLLHMISPTLTLPGYILSMMIAMIVRNIQEMLFKHKISSAEVDAVGDFGLQIFLSIALTTLNLATLFKVENAKIGLLLLLSIPVQSIIVCIFVSLVTFNVMGRDYDAVVICCGQVGFSMGATPTAIANMDTFCKKNGKSIKAYLTIPIVGALFLDFINALLISLFIGFYS